MDPIVGPDRWKYYNSTITQSHERAVQVPAKTRILGSDLCPDGKDMETAGNNRGFSG